MRKLFGSMLVCAVIVFSVFGLTGCEEQGASESENWGNFKDTVEVLSYFGAVKQLEDELGRPLTVEEKNNIALWAFGGNQKECSGEKMSWEQITKKEGTVNEWIRMPNVRKHKIYQAK